MHLSALFIVMSERVEYLALLHSSQMIDEPRLLALSPWSLRETINQKGSPSKCRDKNHPLHGCNKFLPLGLNKVQVIWYFQEKKARHRSGIQSFMLLPWVPL